MYRGGVEQDEIYNHTHTLTHWWLVNGDAEFEEMFPLAFFFFFFLALRDLHSFPLSQFYSSFFFSILPPSSSLPFFLQSIINTRGKESHVLMWSFSHLIGSARVKVQTSGLLMVTDVGAKLRQSSEKSG